MLKAILKRTLPFAAALTFGLFIASFFVGVAAPSVSTDRSFDTDKNEYKGRSCWRQNKNRENRRLREQLRRERMQGLNDDKFENLVPPPPPMAPDNSE